MKITMIFFFTALLTVLLSVVSDCYDPCGEPSDRLKTFALMINAFWIAGNAQDTERPSLLQDLKIYSFRPVDISGLAPAFTYYLEYQEIGVAYAQKIFEVRETEDGLIHMVFSDFANPENFVPGTFELANLTALQRNEIIRNICTISYKQRGRRFVETGRTPVCPGYQTYRTVLTCNKQSFIWLDGEQRIDYFRYRERYSLTPYMQEQLADFHFQCRV